MCLGVYMNAVETDHQNTTIKVTKFHVIHGSQLENLNEGV